MLSLFFLSFNHFEMETFTPRIYHSGSSEIPLERLIPKYLPGYETLKSSGVDKLFEGQKVAFESFFRVSLEKEEDVYEEVENSSKIISPIPQDLLIQGPTGSGKTYAYLFLLLPYLVSSYKHFNMIYSKEKENPQNIKMVSMPKPRITALIVVPTRALGEQVYESLQLLIGGRREENNKNKDDKHGQNQTQTYFKVATALGKYSEAKEAQEVEAKMIPAREMEWKDASVLIATPGRLMALLRSISSLLRGLKILIMDEADALLGTLQRPAFSYFWLSLEAALAREGQRQVQRPGDSLLGNSSDLVRKVLVSASMPDPTLLRAVAGLRGGIVVRAEEMFSDDKKKSNGTEEMSQVLIHDDEQERRETIILPPELKMKVIVGQSRKRKDKDGEKDSFISDGSESLGLLCSYVKDLPRPLLVFTSSTVTAQRLCAILSFILASYNKNKNRTTPVFFIGPSTPADVREKILGPLRRHSTVGKEENDKEEPPIIVSAGVLTRGIDLPSVHDVVILGVPAHSAILAHMAGRASRAYSHGTCTLVVTRDEERKARHILCKVGRGETVPEPGEMDEDCRGLLPSVLEGVAAIERTHGFKAVVEDLAPHVHRRSVLTALRSAYAPRRLG